MITTILEKFFGNSQEKRMAEFQPMVDQINEYEEKFSKLSDQELRDKTTELSERAQMGTEVKELLPESFATVREAAKRTLKMRHFDVQLMGAMALNEGNIAEMKTGEGKTLTATLAVYLNALSKKGVHVVTVNEYLAKRDAQWMGEIYTFLGLTVGTIHSNQDHQEKKAAYECDITYGTNNEFGFDYLRDNMAIEADQKVQRDLNFAIVDEVDSILIDEARTPLVISGAAENATQEYVFFSQQVQSLQAGQDFTIDEKQKAVTLTEEGIAKLEKQLQIPNLYGADNFKIIHHIEQALKAKVIFEKDKDYMISPEGEVMIIDEFTGRALQGRRFSDGLHQAIEAKEKVEIKQESRTLASITYQNYFRLYDKLAGMTGTALTEAEEFASIYDLGVDVIPTNKPISRADEKDAVYKNEKGKFQAIVNEIIEVHKTKQPILVGTTSIEKSELISKLLQEKGIKHEVLNAKQHEREADIVTNAGQSGAITIATNMAGRGTDIKLGEGVLDLGGLYIIGTERHESRRIDNQLRGRSGRQGDKGRSKFFLSMEDEVMKRFGSERIMKMMDSMGIPDDMPIENSMITRSVENAQKKIEGYNFDIRKHILKYDDILNRQRKIIYQRRNDILLGNNTSQAIKDLLASEVDCQTKSLYDPINKRFDESYAKAIHEIAPINIENLIDSNDAETTGKKITDKVLEQFQIKTVTNDPIIWKQAEKQIYLKILDTLWMEHIDAMTHLRENVSLQGFGQRDPLILYKEQGFKMFEKLLGDIQSHVAKTIFHIQITPPQNQE